MEVLVITEIEFNVEHQSSQGSRPQNNILFGESRLGELVSPPLRRRESTSPPSIN